MSNRSVTVEFGVQFFILAVHFNSLSVKVNGIRKIFISVFFISLILVNLSYC